MVGDENMVPPEWFSEYTRLRMDMRVTYHFAMSYAYTGFITVSEDFQHRIEQIFPNRNKNPRLLTVDLPEGSLELKEILRLIREETGLVPQQTSNYKEETGVFKCLRIREYEKRDYEEAEFFLISCVKEVATFAEREQGDTGRFVVHFDKTYRPARKFGCAQTDEYFPLVSDEMLEELRASRIAELRWTEVLTKPPKPKDAPNLWQISSEIVMPPLLNPLSTRNNEPFFGDPVSWEGADPHEGCIPRDGPYSPVEFHYARTAVEALGDFDIARVRELIGRWKSSADFPIIISQRFRKMLKKLKVSDKNFIPVRLVD